MIITHTFLQSGLHRSALNRSQCEILGISYPPEEYWQDGLIGKELSLKESNLFLMLRGDFSLKAQKQIENNYLLLEEFHNKKQPIAKNITLQNKKALQIEITIYCDGACQGNPGEAGSGLAIYQGHHLPTLLFGDYQRLGTNNTAELNALYKALTIASKSDKATIYSDSKYSIDSITTWAYGWKRNGWSKKGGEIKNLEIIQAAHTLYEEIKNKITIKYVKGHSGVEGNELADRMAIMAISRQAVEYEEYPYSKVEDIL